MDTVHTHSKTEIIHTQRSLLLSCSDRGMRQAKELNKTEKRLDDGIPQPMLGDFFSFSAFLISVYKQEMAMCPILLYIPCISFSVMAWILCALYYKMLCCAELQQLDD